MKVVSGAWGVASAVATVEQVGLRSSSHGRRLAYGHEASVSACNGVTVVENVGAIHWKARGRMRAGGMPRAGMSSDS